MRSATAQRWVKPALGVVEPHLPVPWNIDTLVARLSVARSRPIQLIPWVFAGNDPDERQSGLWIPTRMGDYIFYDHGALPVRREQIIGHELGHLLLGHTPKLSDAPDRLLEALAPSIKPDVARRILSRARTGYNDLEEALAEEFGTSLIRRGVSNSIGGPDGELGRLTDSLR